MTRPKKEVWRVNKLYPSYHISSWGRVYSVHSPKSGRKNGLVYGYIHKSRANFYRRFTLIDCLGKPEKVFGHELVGITFPEITGYDPFVYERDNCQFDHGDANTLNNYVYNIEMVTQSENMIRRHRRNKWPTKLK